MRTNCDIETIELLRRVVGMRLERLAARRYPSVLAYSQVVASFSEDLSIRVDLRDETVAQMFEVFVARARPSEPPSDLAEWDRFEFGDFVVAGVFLLRRKEWIDTSEKAKYQLFGQHGVEQRLGSIDDEAENRQAVIVDSGVCFISAGGAELSLDADTFPLLLQLRLEVANAPLPQGSRIPVNLYQTPQ